jgi:probable F420-dependent oxidoreductase
LIVLLIGPHSVKADRVKFGICLFPLQFITSEKDIQSRLENITKSVQLAEASGFDSYWVIDHLLTAQDRYKLPVFEPLTLLSFLLARTTKIRLGTSILIMPLRDPLLLAKVLATLDAFSGGRVTLGAAAGWCKEEFDASGISFTDRGKIFNEQLAIVKRLWTEDNVSFRGDFFSFSNVTINPKPIQKPHIPIWIGAENIDLNAPLRRIASFGDGWLGVTSPRHYARGLEKISKLAISMGRDPSEIQRVNFTYVMTDENSRVAKEKAKKVVQMVHSPRIMPNVERLLVVGNPVEVAGKIKNQIKAGVQYVILNVLSEDPNMISFFSDQVLPLID